LAVQKGKSLADKKVEPMVAETVGWMAVELVEYLAELLDVLAVGMLEKS
jgi:hypothetical protein